MKKPKTTSHSDTPMRTLRQKAYQSKEWQKLRISHLKREPLCQECLKQGKVTAADAVHHIKSPFKTGEINWTLLLDDNNLESICNECHGKEHAKEQGHMTAEEVLKQLEDLMNENKPDSDFE